MTVPDGGDDVEFYAPRIRPYTTTSGRTEPQAPLDVASLVRATGRYQQDAFSIDHAGALALCAAPTSVAELAAHLAQPVMLTKVLLSDLIAAGAVDTKPISTSPPDIAFLERLLDGLRNLR